MSKTFFRVIEHELKAFCDHTDPEAAKHAQALFARLTQLETEREAREAAEAAAEATAEAAAKEAAETAAKESTKAE